MEFEKVATGPAGYDPPLIGYGLATSFSSLSAAAHNATVIALKTEPLASIITYMLPYERDRIQMTSTNLPIAFSMVFLPILILGALVRRQHTATIRRAIMPFAIIFIMRGSCAYRWLPLWDRRTNYQLTLTGFLLALKAVEWGWVYRGRKKMDEVAPGVPKDEKLRAKFAAESPAMSAYRAIKDSWDLFVNWRGLGYDFGSGNGLKLPSIYKDENNRAKWLARTVQDIVARYLVLDVLGSFIFLQPWLPDVPTLKGGTIWSDELSLIPRFLLGTAIHICFAESIMQFGSIVYDVNSLFCVGLLGQSPKRWPPLFGNYWTSTSFGDYWSTKWHQVLRQSFLVLGGYPLGAVFGTLGMVIGTFYASGLLHSWAFYGSGGKPEDAMVWSFTAQALGLICERTYYKVTGKRVNGWFGNIAVILGVFLGGQHCTDTWARNGVAGTTIIPPSASLTIQVLWPNILKFVKNLGLA
ncbi:hypothetical protein FRB94_008350 [Tulasnella sp. JGI-2019a]|nr:hypothetical protein FRB93_002335 [Tulasnella sp. JGI-2019a]KAG8996433.1 hypothetical protein FRB94_008350 [Tulasnella sp. JGI-2019a]KAG9037088.1 hypothetical protein FRB95_006942 [Tulasnella sp. JGI-2019a]